MNPTWKRTKEDGCSVYRNKDGYEIRQNYDEGWTVSLNGDICGGLGGHAPEHSSLTKAKAYVEDHRRFS